MKVRLVAISAISMCARKLSALQGFQHHQKTDMRWEGCPNHRTPYRLWKQVRLQNDILGFGQVLTVSVEYIQITSFDG